MVSFIKNMKSTFSFNFRWNFALIEYESSRLSFEFNAIRSNYFEETETLDVAHRSFKNTSIWINNRVSHNSFFFSAINENSLAKITRIECCAAGCVEVIEFLKREQELKCNLCQSWIFQSCIFHNVTFSSNSDATVFSRRLRSKAFPHRGSVSYVGRDDCFSGMLQSLPQNRNNRRDFINFEFKRFKAVSLVSFQFGQQIFARDYKSHLKSSPHWMKMSIGLSSHLHYKSA